MEEEGEIVSESPILANNSSECFEDLAKEVLPEFAIRSLVDELKF